MVDENKDQVATTYAPITHHKVGPGTPSSKLKAMWKETCFTAEKGNRGRLLPNGRWMSLKAFARSLIADGNEMVKAWWDNKGGSLNKKRTAEKLAKISEEKRASKGTKKK
jgi:hypothetical protein